MIYFADRPSLKHGLFNSYIQSFSKIEIKGFKRNPFYTKLIDLSNPNLLESFNKETQYEIRKSQNDGILCKVSDDLSEFTLFYNEFAKEKNMSKQISSTELKKYGEAFILRNAYSTNGTLLVSHSYIADWSIKRVRILTSSSKIHNNNLDRADRKLIGRANRLLHYEDMIFFRNLGYLIYDFGGYAYETQDQSLQGINRFKDHFGGELVEESNYESYLLYLIKCVMGFLKINANRFKPGKAKSQPIT
ncbi:MAG TPA: hypothetical protein PLX08_02990 [Bacteroidales bacterium]|nr:hypothetical protein [Bacteroidales bacterium]